MLNIIKADLFRILKGKGIYIIIILLFLLSLMSAYTVSPLNVGLNVSGDTTENYGLSDEWLEKLYSVKSMSETRDILINHGRYEVDVANVVHNNNMYYFFIAVVVFVLCCDFSNGTIKNTVSTNISKKKYYFSKLLLAIGLGTIITFLNVYFAYFSNLFMNGNSFVSSLSNITLLTIRQLPLLYAIISVLITIAVIVRKTSIYNGISIPLLMLFQLILGFMNTFNLPKWIYNYEFETALGKLCLNPTNTYIMQTLSLWTIVFIITTIIGYSYFKKRDI